MEYDSPMACECGSPWGIIEGNTLICGRCGYRHTIPLKPTYEELEKRVEFLETEIRRHRMAKEAS